MSSGMHKLFPNFAVEVTEQIYGKSAVDSSVINRRKSDNTRPMPGASFSRRSCIFLNIATH